MDDRYEKNGKTNCRIVVVVVFENLFNSLGNVWLIVLSKSIVSQIKRQGKYFTHRRELMRTSDERHGRAKRCARKSVQPIQEEDGQRWKRRPVKMTIACYDNRE